MKKLIKKFISTILVVVLILIMAPLSGFVGFELPDLFKLSASAATYNGTCGDNLTWSLDTETGELIISGTGAMDDCDLDNPLWESYKDVIKFVIIRDGVTTIGKYAFFYCSSLTSVTIPSSVTTIGELALAGCDSLTSVSVDDDNQYYSSDLYGVLYNKNKTDLIQYPIGNKRTSFTIPNSVTTIVYCAFNSCDSLTSVTIPDSVTIIGNSSFCNCSNLKNVKIGNSVTLIGSYAFSDCYSLTSVTMTSSIAEIGDSAFYICPSLTDVYYNGTLAQWNEISINEGNNPIKTATIHFREAIANGTCGDDLVWTLYNDGELVISGTGAMTNYSSDSSVPWKSYRSSIKSVSLPGGLTSIGSNAFSDCTGLTSVTIPDSVTSIEDFAFYDCTDITSVTIGNGVKSIGFVAFNGCTGLTNITIPDSVTSIDASAFAECTSLARFTINSGNQFYSSDSYGVMFNKNKTKLIQYPIGNSRTSYLIPDSVTIIGYEAFANCSNLTSVAIPDSVTSIAQYAFYGCTDITSITIPNGVTRINYCVFRYCESLVSVTIPDSVTDIGDHAFFSCTSLTNITIPDSVTSIGDDAFWDCSNLLSVAIGKSVTAIGDCAFDYCSKLIGAYYHGTEDDWSKIDIGENNENLIENVVFIDPEKEIIDSGECGEKLIWYLYEDGELVIIGTGTMENYLSSSSVPWYSYCSNIKSVSLPDGLTSIGQYAFWDCTGLTSVTIPDSVTSVGERAFTGCTGLASIIIPNSVTSIGYSTFSDCTGLTSVIIGNNVTSIGNRAFSGCTSLTNITIPDSVTSIDQSAFSGCTSLTNIIIPDSVTSIGSRAFWDCTGLTSVTIGNSVTSIGFSAFDYCTGLTSVTIGNSVTSIGSDAFMGCTSLENVYYTGDIAGWCSITYSNIDSNPMYCADNLYINGELLQGGIVIPNSVTSIGEYSFYNCTGLTSVTIPDSVTSIDAYAFSGCTSITDVYYQGTEEEWAQISIAENNDPLLNATIHFPHTHSYKSIVTTSATCTTDGVMTYTCDCGDSYTEVIIKTGHSLTPVTVPSTCTVNGMEYDMCFDCGETFNVTVLPLTNHNYIDEVIEATCTSQGYTKHSCENCDSEYINSYVDATGHTYTEQIIKQPTCTAAGKKQFMCHCGDSYTENIKASGHKLVHNRQEPTCSEDGFDIYTCSVCALELQKTTLPATGNHKLSIMRQEPTCQDLGMEYSVCDDCGNVIGDTIILPATGHSYGEWIISVPATCTEDGLRYKECVACSYKVEETVSKTGHNVSVVRQDPTCENFGMEYNLCNDCGNIIGDTVILPATGHNYGEWIVSTPATCTEDGLHYKECAGCSDRIEETIPKYEHSYQETVVNPTCTEQGYTKHICERCDNEYVDCYIDSIGHNYGNWQVVTNPTTTSTGLMVRKCSNCDDSIEMSIPELIPNYVTSVELSLDKLVLSLHESATLTAVVKPDTAIITGVIWSSSNPDIVSVDNGVLTTKRPGTSIITVKTVDGDFEDYCFVRVNGLKSVTGTHTVIDNESSIIYGISTNLQSLDGYIDVLDENINLVFNTETLGTGTSVSLEQEDELIDSYTIVVFGDVNGDGWYDGQDAVLVSCLANGMLTKDDVSESVYMAADCNHDGTIDQLDVDLLNSAGVLLANVDQSKPTEELLETSSVYVEYLDIIDQTVELDVEDDETTKKEYTEDENNASTPVFENGIFAFFSEFIAFLENLLNFILTL